MKAIDPRRIYKRTQDSYFRFLKTYNNIIHMDIEMKIAHPLASWKRFIRPYPTTYFTHHNIKESNFMKPENQVDVFWFILNKQSHLNCGIRRPVQLQRVQRELPELHSVDQWSPFHQRISSTRQVRLNSLTTLRQVSGS